MYHFKKSVCPILTEPEKAYIAGILDGEGTIGFRGRIDKGITLIIKISNTDKTLTDFLFSKLPNGSRTFLRKRSNPKHKPVWEMQWRAFNVVKNILSMLLPYLIIKKQRALLALEYIKSREMEREEYIHGIRDSKGRFFKSKENRYTKYDIELIEKMHKYNRRGL